MEGRWNLFTFLMHKALCVLLMFCLLNGKCSSINLEGSALLEFRSRVELDPYGALRNWNPNDSIPCNWTGVYCVDGNVVTLNLREFCLQGVLAPELGKLSHLKVLVLYGNKFSGLIPKEIGGLTMLELLDLRNNMLSGTIPKEIGKILSLKHLLLCHNRLQGDTLVIGNTKMHFALHDPSIACDVPNEMVPANRNAKYFFWETGWQKLRNLSSILVPLKGRIMQAFEFCLLSSFVSKEGFPNGRTKRNDGPITGLNEPYILSNVYGHADRRILTDQEMRNFFAAPGSSGPVPQIVSVAPMPSGSFLAKPNPSVASTSQFPIISPSTPTNAGGNDLRPKKKSTWVYLLVLPVVALLLTLALCLCLICRKKGAARMRPWKTGLSGQLQKAFITGVPKLKHEELRLACEDFSNIVFTHPEFIIYKGILSNGVEIAVISTSITTAKSWSRHADSLFKKKIETLSRINHKNFVNLLGFCVEDTPFIRMMVLEYAPNGSLYEHLHVDDHDHLDWSARMRIIMGVAYSLQHMHGLNPPISHPNLLSNTIFLSEDNSAKVVDITVWNEIYAKVKATEDDKEEKLDQSENLPVDPATNVYFFGMLLLEVISGKAAYSKEHNSLLNMIAENQSGKVGAGSLVDPTLKSHKDEELDIICEVVRDCVNANPKKRPTMEKVTSKLKGVIGISPEAAVPRLSPLWWAELEILSAEAS